MAAKKPFDAESRAFLDDMLDAGAVLFELGPRSHLGCLPTGRSLLLVLSPAVKVKEEDTITEDGEPSYVWEQKTYPSKNLEEIMTDLALAGCMVYQVLVRSWKPKKGEEETREIEVARWLVAEQGDDEILIGEPEWVHFEEPSVFFEEMLAADLSESTAAVAGPVQAHVSDDGEAVSFGDGLQGVRVDGSGVTLGKKGTGMVQFNVRHPLFDLGRAALKNAPAIKEMVNAFRKT